MMGTIDCWQAVVTAAMLVFQDKIILIRYLFVRYTNMATIIFVVLFLKVQTQQEQQQIINIVNTKISNNKIQ